MHKFCPYCGYNFVADAPVTLGDWYVAPDHATYRDEYQDLTPGEAAILHSIATQRGEPVRRTALLERVSDSDSVNTVSVLVCRMRKKLGDRSPIRTIRGRGYAWCN